VFVFQNADKADVTVEKYSGGMQRRLANRPRPDQPAARALTGRWYPCIYLNVPPDHAGDALHGVAIGAVRLNPGLVELANLVHHIIRNIGVVFK